MIRSTGRLVVTSSNSLTIRSVTTNDVGNYECSAKNAEGRVSRITKLIIAGMNIVSHGRFCSQISDVNKMLSSFFDTVTEKCLL